MKRIVNILMIVIIISQIFTMPGYTKVDFNDLEKTHWAYDAILSLKELGIINGYSNGEYRPDNPVTFNEFIKLLVVAHGGQVETDAFDWAKPYRAYGISKGWFNDGFYPYDEPITRQVCAFLIDQYFNEKLESVGPLIKEINDYNLIDEIYKVNVLKAYGLGILGGDNHGNFNPSAQLSRAECAIIITRLLNEDLRNPVQKNSFLMDEIEGLKLFEDYLILKLNITDVQKINDITMARIRYERYGEGSGSLMSPFWVSVAGNLSNEYTDYVETHSEEPYYIESLSNTSAIHDPGNNDAIDFIHMIAVIDAMYSNSSADDKVEKYIDYLCGFAGDTETFAINLNNYEQTNGTMAYDAKFIYALNHIGEIGNHFFTKEDYLADIDAINIANLLLEKNYLLSDALNEYYGADYKSRYSLFVNSFGGEKDFEKVIANLINGENSPLGNDFTTFRTMIVMTNGGNFFNQPSLEDTKAVYNAFHHKILLGVEKE